MILESMKMEIPIQAGANSTVQSIAVREGDSVTEGQVVAVLA
jgi:acetyl-CoA carboxylase biotin carboxyl carrier protein